MQIWKHLITKTPYALVENTCGIVELSHTKGSFSRVMKEERMLSNFSSNIKDDISNNQLVVSLKPFIGLDDLIEDIKIEITTTLM